MIGACPPPSPPAGSVAADAASGYRSIMGRARWAAVVLYVGAIFLSLPYTPRLVKLAGARFGPGAVLFAVGAVLAVAGALLLARLSRSRAAFPRPHVGLAAIGAAAWAAWSLLASSPVGRVHLPQYGLLAVLAARAIGATPGAAFGGGAVAAGIGLADELVQGVTPGRVFDWWDVALNAAAGVLGAAAWAWWRWTGREAP